MTIRASLVLLAFLVLPGCGEDLGDYVNKKFPPVTLEDQQQMAASTAVAAMKKLDAPNIAFGISASEARAIMLTDAVKKAGVRDLKISSANQLLKVEAEFERTFTGEQMAEA
jgi:hypothetical protein